MKTLHKPAQDRKLRVCAYARISNDKEELEGSLKTQVDYYTDLILRNPEWEYCGLYADEGISGTTISERAQFKSMIQKARQGQIDIILVKSISRFSRNVIDALKTLRELKEKNVEVYFEEQDLSSLDFKCDQILTLYAKFAEEEALNVSANVKWRFKKNMQDASYAFPTNLMGYTKDERGKIAIDEGKAKWIRLIYQMYVDERSFDEIMDTLEANHVLSPAGLSKWTRNTIKSILMNEKYVGDCIMQKSYVEDPLTHKRLRNYGEKEKIYIKNGHPPIVDRETWVRAQEIRQARAKQFKSQTGRISDFEIKPDFTFTKFAYCPYCGNAYVSKVNHYNGQKTRRYILCSSNRYSHKCQGEPVFNEVLSIGIIDMINYLKSHESEFKRALIKEFTDPEQESKETELKVIIAQLAKFKEKYIKLADLYDDFSTMQKNELSKRINALTSEKRKLENDLITVETPEVRAHQFIKALKELPTNASSIKEIDFRTLFNYVLIKNKNDLIFIIGNGDFSKVDIEKTPLFTQKVEYRVRKTYYICKCGIQIVR